MTALITRSHLLGGLKYKTPGGVTELQATGSAMIHRCSTAVCILKDYYNGDRELDSDALNHINALAAQVHRIVALLEEARRHYHLIDEFAVILDLFVDQAKKHRTNADDYAKTLRSYYKQVEK